MPQWFYCGFTLPPDGTLFFLYRALLRPFFPLCGFPGFPGLFFADGTGALVTTYGLRFTHRMEPLSAFFIGALAAR